MFTAAKLACKFGSQLMYGDDEARYNTLERLVNSGSEESKIMSHIFSLAERLIQIDPTGAATTTNPKVMEQFATLLSNNPQLFSKTPKESCHHSYQELSVGDLLYHAGMISAAHNHHDVALKIYAHTLTLQHTKTCGHTERVNQAQAISLIASNRYQEAATQCDTKSLQNLYGNHPVGLTALLQKYENLGLHTEAIMILRKLKSADPKNVFINNLFIKKLAIYVALNPSNSSFISQLASELYDKKEGVLKELERQLIEEQQFAGAYYIANSLPKANVLPTPLPQNNSSFFSRLYQNSSSPKIESPPSAALLYAYKAYDANQPEQAYHLFQNVLKEDLSTNTIEHIYTYLEALSLSAVACNKLGEYPAIIAPLLKHSRCNIKDVLQILINLSNVSDDCTRCLKSLLPQINERLNKQPELLTLYEHLLSKKGLHPLSQEDITHWFTPLIKLYNKDPLKATTMLFAEMNYFDYRDPRKASLEALLKEINLPFFEGIEAFRRCLITGHIHAESTTYLKNFQTAHQTAPANIKELYSVILNVAQNACSITSMPILITNPDIKKAIVHIQNYLQLIPTPTDQVDLSGLDNQSIQSLPMTQEPLPLPHNTHPTTSIFIDLIPTNPNNTNQLHSITSSTIRHSMLSTSSIDDDATEIQMDPISELESIDEFDNMSEEEFKLWMIKQTLPNVEEDDPFLSVPTTPISLAPVDHESIQFKSEDDYQDWIIANNPNRSKKINVQGYGRKPLNS